MIDNKRIAKNTLLLYLRMFLLMGISLYTSRIVLETLGVEDFGVYNIVGSIIVLFSFINNALTAATRRFINFNLGKNNPQESAKAFSASLTIHFIICIILIIISESIGLWFLNTQLNIPENRMYAANWVYQFSILSACIGIIGAPYESTIVAYEKMSVYSYLSIIEGVFKLIIVYMLVICTTDKLIFYSALIFIVGILVSSAKWIYCSRNFPICRYQFMVDKPMLKAIASFSGWSLFGQIAYIGSTSGLNMIINIFCGVLLNAATGIAQQVNSAIYNFVSNFQTAFNPQLIQTYSSGNLEVHRVLLSRASRISYYLLYIISLPVLINTSYILHLWLKEVPDHSVTFTQLIITFSLIEALGAPLWMSMQATGKIKTYQIIVSSINALNIPIAFVCLYQGLAVESIFYAKILIGLLMYIFRVLYILPLINFSYMDYFKKVVYPTVAITLFTICILFIVSTHLDGGEKLLITTPLSIVLCAGSIYYIGINKQEKQTILQIIKKWKIQI